jgi:hypothetical protein
MTGLDPAIQSFSAASPWMAGSGAGHEEMEGRTPRAMTDLKNQFLSI